MDLKQEKNSMLIYIVFFFFLDAFFWFLKSFVTKWLSSSTFKNPNPYLFYRPKASQSNECLLKVVVQ